MTSPSYSPRFAGALGAAVWQHTQERYWGLCLSWPLHTAPRDAGGGIPARAHHQQRLPRSVIPTTPVSPTRCVAGAGSKMKGGEGYGCRATDAQAFEQKVNRRLGQRPPGQRPVFLLLGCHKMAQELQAGVGF